MKETVEFNRTHNEDLIAGVLRQHIAELNHVLRDFEDGRFMQDPPRDQLQRLEQQLRWLRKNCLNN